MHTMGNPAPLLIRSNGGSMRGLKPALATDIFGRPRGMKPAVLRESGVSRKNPGLPPGAGIVDIANH